MNLQFEERVRIAYKKLKASVYFDKTQLPLRDRLVAYEGRGIEDQLQSLAAKLTGSDSAWEAFQEEILNTVSAFAFPKTLEAIPEDMVILNSDSTPIRMKKPQYFIDLSVEGHILSTLWVLSVGMLLDKNCEDDADGMYEHSYGNRLKKNLINENSGDITYSPYLFEPYFSQYESWRDYGLNRAKERLDDKQDALILTLDLRSFYYSVNLQKKDFDTFIMAFEKPETWIIRVNEFVYHVLCKYSEKLRLFCQGTDLSVGMRTVLPIGFLPSNILANWVLTPFDDAVIQQWNPVYYGRYVDDIIIVDKVEKNSPLYKRARDKSGKKRLTSDEVINMFLINAANGTNPILQYDVLNPDKITYQVNPGLFSSQDYDICVQNSKVKVFYFQSGATQALLNCFKTNIARNISEFRMMPDIDRVLYEKDYSEIFNLKNSDSINKLRSVDGIAINKFAMSKFLGKYRKVSGLINDKKKEDAFEKDLLVILDERTLIENYGVWERILEILVVNNRAKLLEKCSLRILSAIERYEVPDGSVHTQDIRIKDGLLLVLRSALCRVLALTWGNEIDSIIDKVNKELLARARELDCSQTVLDAFDPAQMRRDRLNYCRFRMVNKYVLPLPIDCILDQLAGEDYPVAQLCELSDGIHMINPSWIESHYRYYPYMLTPQEISFALLCSSLHSKDFAYSTKEQEAVLKNLYLSRNFPNVQDLDRPIFDLAEVQVKAFSDSDAVLGGNYITHVGKKDGSDGKDKLCVAIGNAELKLGNFRAALDGKPNRSYQRYRHLSKILDAAIEQKVDLLVLPENYLPLEWLPTVSRFCANNQMGLVTGIEHIVSAQEESGKPYVYNLTAVILPYMHDRQTFSHITCHHKVKYSPEEKRQIEGHNGIYCEGNAYHLFCWHDIWFPVYCCFELASIQDRALFRSYSDMVVAVEWNSDVAYFSSIVESMCRDLHCYCIQANSSGPGDSRVLQPARTELRDIIKTKGGKNPCILATEIDIKSLRDFQALDYSLQKDEKTFKTTPPDFNLSILQKKRDGTLFDWIKEKEDS